MAVFEIPLGPAQRTLSIAMLGVTYGLRTTYADAPEGGWFLDIADAKGAPILCGLALVPGTNLLTQYAYLGLGVGLWVFGDAGAPPLSYDNLGTSWHLIYSTDDP